MLDFDQIHSCYGCGLCSIACPESIVDMKLSAEGFYIPVISNKDKCIHCDLCEKVCSYADGFLSQPPLEIQGYVGCSKDRHTKETCASGGIGFEIARHLISKGYKACGVKYSNIDNRAEHFVADTVEDFEKSKGSKYLQSYTIEGFKKLNNKDKWVVFGCPCQVDSLRRWIKLKKMEENYVLVDFFCHGVPSYYLWDSFLASSRKAHDLQKFDEVKFRDKRGGSGMDSFKVVLRSGQEEIVSKSRSEDMFYRFFLGNYCLNASCYDKCKFKNLQSSADIRIGDLWEKATQQGHEGFSAVFVNSQKGMSILSGLNETCLLKREALNIVSDGQMVNRLEMPRIRNKVIRDLSKGKSLAYIYTYLAISRKIKRLPSYMVKRIINLFKRG